MKRKVELLEDLFNAFFCSKAADSDTVDKTPIAEAMNEELRLFAPLAVHVVNCVFPGSCVCALPVNLAEPAKIIEPIGDDCNAVSVRKNEWCSAFMNALCCRDKVNEWLLAFGIASHPSGVKLKEHR